MTIIDPGALRGALPKVPMNPRLKEYPSGREDVKLYAFTLDCPSDGPCVGWLAVPAKPGKYPLRAKFFGYNESWQPRAMAVRKPEELSAKELRVDQSAWLRARARARVLRRGAEAPGRGVWRARMGPRAERESRHVVLQADGVARLPRPRLREAAA